MKKTKVLVSTLALVTLGACTPSRPAPAEPPSAESTSARDQGAHRSDSADPHGGHGMGHGHGKSGGPMTDGMCPMKVPGVTVSTSDVEAGVSIVFTTTTGDVGDLRARVLRMAEMHDQMGGMHRGGGHMKHGADGGTRHGRMMEDPDGGASEHGVMRGCLMGEAGGMHAASASVEDVEGGARLILKPKNGADLQALRAHVQRCRDRMQSGECPMMGGRGTAPEAESPAR